MLGLRGSDRSDFFRVHERLIDDPRSASLHAEPVVWAGWPDAWWVPFGNGGRLVYRILEDPPQLKPLYVDAPGSR